VSRRADAGVSRRADAALVTQMVLGMLVAPIVPVLRGVEPPPSPEERRLYAETAIDVLMDGVCAGGAR
jgi:hypothetical protein